MKRKYFDMKKLFVAIALVLMSFVGEAQQSFCYAHRDTMDLYMDVYQPATPRSDHACVLYVFGGGFFSGARNDQTSVHACSLLAERGFVVASIDYRLFMKHAPKVPLLKMYTLFDTAIRYAVEDCADAVSYLCGHAKELNIDPSKIILTGSSAGAITVLQTDYCRCNHLPEVSSIPQCFKPAAVVPYSGAIFCRNKNFRYAQSPAPTCFFHGTKDKVVNYHRMRGSLHHSLFGADKVSKLYAKNDYNYWILRYDGIGHEVATVLPKTINEFCAFVDAALAGRVMRYDAHCQDTNIQPTSWTKMNVFDLYFGKGLQ